MRTGRLEAFSDGVLAIVLTIMVLELKVPANAERLVDLWPLWPVFLSYVLSFAYVAIYWNNHHHLVKAAKRISGRAMWANMILLFWLSLVPFATGWMGVNRFAPAPTALYGAVMLMAGLSYWMLQSALIAANGRCDVLAAAVGRDLKGKASVGLYTVAVPLAYVSAWAACAIYVGVAVMWVIPDRRIEREVERRGDPG